MSSTPVNLFLIAITAFLCYSNTFDVPFVFDDNTAIVENPLIRDLGYFADASEVRDFKEIRYNALKRRYVGYLSFALNYKANGLSVGGYHAINILIHILNGMLIYLLITLTFRTPVLNDSRLKGSSGPIALVTALLFVSHPVQTQAVTYIVQRLASMTAMFYLLSLVLYIKARLSEGGKRAGMMFYVLSLVSAILGMYTKQIAFTLPVAILLYEFLFLSGSRRKRLLYLTPILLTMLIIPLSLLDMEKPLEEIIGDAEGATRIEDISRMDYLLTEFRVFVTYLRLLALPVHQNLDYDYPVYRSFLDPQVFLSFMFFLSLFGLGLYFLRRSRTADSALRIPAFGIFWLFLAFSVESSIIPLHVIYEHRVYLPSVGFFAALATAGFLFIERYKGLRMQKAVVGMIALVLIMLAGATYLRNNVWRSNTSIWEDVVRKSPQKGRGHNNLGEAYEMEGQIDRAIYEYKTAIRLDPSYPQAYNNLGTIYESSGLIDEAIEQYMMALRLQPDSTKAHNNLGIAYRDKGLIDEAIEQYMEALSLNPLVDMSHFNLAAAYREKGSIDEAIKEYTEALRLNPDSTHAHNNLGVIYRDKGMIDEAIKEYLEALRLNPGYEKARYNLGVAYWDKGLIDDAIEQYRIAIEIEPEDEEAHLALGVAYSKKGDMVHAREELETALRLNPGDTTARGVLNWVKAQSR
jgi:tetratricopeptide (TPR) repeat protein